MAAARKRTAEEETVSQPRDRAHAPNPYDPPPVQDATAALDSTTGVAGTTMTEKQAAKLVDSDQADVEAQHEEPGEPELEGYDVKTLSGTSGQPTAGARRARGAPKPGKPDDDDDEEPDDDGEDEEDEEAARSRTTTRSRTVTRSRKRR